MSMPRFGRSSPGFEKRGASEARDRGPVRLRNKLLLAMAVPTGLLVLQVAVVAGFVREQQKAVAFISSGQRVIEASFVAAERVRLLREAVKELPSA